MKILHISECIKGGVATYLNELYDNNNKYDFYFFIPDNHLSYITNQAINNHRVITFNKKKRNIKFFIQFYIFLAKNIKKINPDIIHLHGTFAGFLVRTYYYFSFKRPKIIYCSHGWSFLMEIGFLKKKLFLIIEKILSIKSDAIINISEFDYQRSIDLGISKKKSIKIINSINPIIKQKDKKIINYINDKVNFLFIGRLDKQKGFDKLFDYFYQNTEHVLHVVGDFVTNNPIKYPESENINLYGWVDYPDIHNCYIDSDVEISFDEINNIVKYRCGVCHSNKSTFEGFEDPPLGIVFDEPEDILKNINKIKAQVIDSDIMPPGNLTGITEYERNKIRLWIKQGAYINN